VSAFGYSMPLCWIKDVRMQVRSWRRVLSDPDRHSCLIINPSSLFTPQFYSFFSMVIVCWVWVLVILARVIRTIIHRRLR
jgi:hypothetical protein